MSSPGVVSALGCGLPFRPGRMSPAEMRRRSRRSTEVHLRELESDPALQELIRKTHGSHALGRATAFRNCCSLVFGICFGFIAGVLLVVYLHDSTAVSCADGVFHTAEHIISFDDAVTDFRAACSYYISESLVLVDSEGDDPLMSICNVGQVLAGRLELLQRMVEASAGIATKAEHEVVRLQAAAAESETEASECRRARQDAQALLDVCSTRLRDLETEGVRCKSDLSLLREAEIERAAMMDTERREAQRRSSASEATIADVRDALQQEKLAAADIERRLSSCMGHLNSTQREADMCHHERVALQDQLTSSQLSVVREAAEKLQDNDRAWSSVLGWTLSLLTIPVAVLGLALLWTCRRVRILQRRDKNILASEDVDPSLQIRQSSDRQHMGQRVASRRTR